MFRNKSAWFSSSVPETCHDFWIEEGGSIAGWRTADYLFSADATCRDTLRIFESKDYLWNKVVVFHSMFLSTCEKRHSVQSVCIGHYVLPPVRIQDEVRHVVGRLIWECKDEESMAEDFHAHFSLSTDEEHSEISKSDSESSATNSLQSEDPCTADDRLTGYISMDSLQQYSGDLCDISPGCFRCSSCDAHCWLPHT